MIIKSKHIFTEGGEFDGYITVESGKVASISAETTETDNVLDYSDYRVIPGIIDVHNHGFGGWSMTDPADENIVEGYLKALTSIGVTGVLPTAKIEAFDAIATVSERELVGAKVLGIHSEGPFWARGGENTIGMTWPKPDVETVKEYIKAAKGKLKVMAIAPELENAYDVIRYLHQNKIKVACCHTAAHSEEIHKAKREVNFEIVTHLGNGMRGMHHRDVGVLGAVLLENNLYYEIITDLNHICPEMLQIYFKLQPYDKFCLISDSNFIAGLETGTYMRYGREMYANEKGLILNSDGRICGSGRWVLSNMRQLENVVQVPFEDIVKMASLIPAKYLNIDDKKGSIAVGKDADIVVIDDNFKCKKTFVEGKLLYDNDVTEQKRLFNPEAIKLRISDKTTIDK